MLLFLKNLVFVLVVPGAFAVYVPWFIARGQPIGPPAFVFASVLLVVLGVALYFWCLWGFAVLGRGTPAPIDPPRHLVVRGPYRYVRNPMYLCVLCVILGWAVLFQSLALFLYALAAGAVFHLFTLLYEEPHLRKVFGAEYEDYCARVSRWLPMKPPRDAR